VEERRFSAASAGKDGGALAPVASDLAIFRTFAKAGKRLAEIHVHYEQQPEYPITKTEKAGEKLDYRVTKMKAEQRQNIAHL
jgi:predicted helicase